MPTETSGTTEGAFYRLSVGFSTVRQQTPICPPGWLRWLLDQIEQGVFLDPSEAVFVILSEHQELEPHADMREILKRPHGKSSPGADAPGLCY